jgi:4-amino-4-deoxy-L-arabinose transferase-like glycosyltransferase
MAHFQQDGLPYMSDLNFSTRQRRILLLILLLYIILALMYAWATPPLEASDEYKHYPVVQHIQTTGTLPILDPQAPGRWLQEGAQPPLYYLLMAGITTPLDTTDLADVYHKNPFAFIGNPNQIGNKNLIIHDPAEEAFPWQGSVLAIYLIRFASILLGVGTILTTALLGRDIFSPRVGILAAALIAFNPMFLFVSAAVNNDSLANFLGVLALYLLVTFWQSAPDPIKKWWQYAGLGLLIGLGMLTKLSLGGLLGVAGLAMLWLSWRQKNWRILFVGGTITLLTALLVSGWWFVRNWHLYGDLTGLNAFIAVQGTRDTPITWQGWREEFGTFYRSFWGLFGGVNVIAPEIVYHFFNVVMVIGALGLLWQWFTKKTHLINSGGWLLLVWTAVLSMLLIRWNIISPAFQGRLLFPALGAICVLLAFGLLSWVKETWQPKLALGLAGLIGFIAFLLPWTTIRPAYAMPQPLTTVPDDALLAEPITFQAENGRLQLLGIAMAPDQHIQLGDPVILTVYWQAVDPVTEDYLSSVHILGRDYASAGDVNRHPAMGMIPTSRWQAGDIYQDVYHVYPNKTAVMPTQLLASLSFFDLGSGQTLPATNPAGVSIDPLLVGTPAALHAADATSTKPGATRLASFHDGIMLVDADLPETAVPGSTVPINLTWAATGTPSLDYTVFVQLLDSSREQVAGADAPPVNNFFPTTLWQADDHIDDQHQLTIPANLPPGSYPLLIGLYDPESGARLLRQDKPMDFIELTLQVGE